uniref:Uncharacterized protein n=1 Tax=Glossina pallidipes TaxID=7398 RepID=A0A1A9ZGH6_GLOPL
MHGPAIVGFNSTAGKRDYDIPYTFTFVPSFAYHRHKMSKNVSIFHDQGPNRYMRSKLTAKSSVWTNFKDKVPINRPVCPIIYDMLPKCENIPGRGIFCDNGSLRGLWIIEFVKKYV